jgi:hypothetical protein
MIQPSPDFRHLRRLTDSIGLFEHADLTSPRRELGYCLDDVARALVIVLRQTPLPGGQDPRDLTDVYLSFVLAAQHPDGLFRNRRGQSVEWRRPAGSGDCWGRAIWVLGVTATRHSDSRVREVALAAFDRSVHWRSPWRRSMAYGTLGAAAVLTVYPGHQGAKGFLSGTVRRIVPREDEAWPWPDERLSFANALLPEALLAAGAVLPDSKAQRDGLHLLDWLADIETSGDHLSVTPVRGRDGLTATGRNEKKGAESTLALIATRQNARLCLAVIA